MNTPTLQMLHNGFCLHVQRFEGDNWLLKGKQLLEQSITAGNGLKDDLTLLSQLPSEPAPDAGNPSTTA